jgi:hypothetical protein
MGYCVVLEVLQDEFHGRVVGKAAILVGEPEVLRVQVDDHGRGLALVLAQDVLAVAHIRFAQLLLLDGLIGGGLGGRSALGGRWAWWIATARCLASSRDLGGGHGGKYRLGGRGCVGVCVGRDNLGADQRSKSVRSAVLPGEGLRFWGARVHVVAVVR